MISLQFNTTKRINEVWKMDLSVLLIKDKINNFHFRISHDYWWWKRTKLITYWIMGVGTIGSCLIGIILMFFQLLWNKKGIDSGHLWLVVAGICCCLLGAVIITCLLLFMQIITNKFKANYLVLFHSAVKGGYLVADSTLYPDLIRLCFYANNPYQWQIDYPLSIFKSVDLLWGLVIIFTQIKQYQTNPTKFKQLHNCTFQKDNSVTKRSKKNQIHDKTIYQQQIASIYYLFFPSYVKNELSFNYCKIINPNKPIYFDFKLAKNISWLIKRHFYKWIFYISWWVIFIIAMIITGVLSTLFTHQNPHMAYSLYISCWILLLIAIIFFLCIGATITSLINNQARHWLTIFQNLWNNEQVIQQENSYPLIVQMAFNYNNPDLWNEKHPDVKFHYAYVQLGLLSMLSYLKNYQIKLGLDKDSDK